MCSISGYITDKPLPREAARRLGRALVFYGAERGEQSAGLFTHSESMDRIFKRAMKPADFVEHPAFASMFDGGTTLFLGHTRLPTCGGRGRAQAQPFRAPNTVTVHNGMIWDAANAKSQWGLRKKSGVDSELVTDFIEAYGIKAIPYFFEETSGSSAIAAWYKERLYLARDSNPTVCSRFKVGETSVTAFASTSSILENSLRHAFLGDAFEILATPTDKVLHVTAKETEEIAEWEDSFSYLRGEGSYGEGSLYGETYGEAYDEYDDTRGWKSWRRKSKKSKKLEKVEEVTSLKKIEVSSPAKLKALTIINGRNGNGNRVN